MILPPAASDGLGVAILNSNAEAHFFFTNALGMVSAEQTRRLGLAIELFPGSHWIVAMHHHLIEYPMSMAAFSERVGTALINGSWFVRKLRSLRSRAVVMHGHRHIDWIGACGSLKIISAPSPVMGANNEAATHFHIHTLTLGSQETSSVCYRRNAWRSPASTSSTDTHWSLGFILRPNLVPVRRTNRPANGWMDADRRT